MSSSDQDPAALAASVCLEQAAATLSQAFGEPGRISDEALQNLMRHAVRLYAAKAEAGMRSPFPPRGGGVTTDDVMIAATDMLHALNVQLFELSMWQAMTGNCIAADHRADPKV